MQYNKKSVSVTVISSITELREHMSLCVGFDDQHEWLSRKPIDPQSSMGFTYVIHDTLADRFYIGCKLFWFKRLKMIQGKKKRTTEGSDWSRYYGSSKHLTAEIAKNGEDKFDRYHIDSWGSKRSIANEEANLLHKLDVLTIQKDCGEYWFYNQGIGKAYRYEGHTQELKNRLPQALRCSSE